MNWSVFSGLRRAFKNLKLKYKLLLSYFVLIIIPLGILTTLTYSKSAEILEGNMIELTGKSLEQASASLDGRLENVVKLSEIITLNNDILDILSRDPAAYDGGRQYDDFQRLQAYLRDLQDNQEIFRIRIYIQEGLLYSRENNNFFNLDSIKNEEWYGEVLSRGGRIHWMSDYTFTYGGINEQRKLVTAARAINNYRMGGRFVGILCLDILESSLDNQLRKISEARSGIFYLLNEKSAQVAGTDNGKKYPLDTLLSHPVEINKWTRTHMKGQEYLLCGSMIKNPGWKLVALIPLEEILQPSIKLRNYAFVLMIAIGFAAYLVAWYISHFTMKRVGGLIGSMRKAKAGQLDIKVEVDAEDEIGELEDNFNTMISRISELVEEKYRMGQEVKSAELKALQAQINPHFLYNTLDLISSKAGRNKPEDVKDIVRDLARFYKLSLSRGKDIISVQDELAHVQTYVRIQNKRFNDRIGLEVEMDEKAKQCCMIKLVLQPLVENSILHGILEKPDRTGTLRIQCFVESGQLIFKVADDGVGMEQATVEAMLNGTLEKSRNGFGVKNVLERIRLFYGEQYGLRYKSMPGAGTEVEIRIPAVAAEV